MHTDAPARKAGRLSREDQRRLGDILKRVYDDVIRQGVPERFKVLLTEFDVSTGRAGGEQTGTVIHGRGEGSSDRKEDNLSSGESGDQKGLASNKGSH